MLSKDTVVTASTAVLAVCAVFVTALNVHQRWVQSSRVDSPWYIVPDWQQYASAGHRIGPPNAKVNIVMFSDYQCNACRALMPVIDAVRAQHATSVGLVIRHFPLEGHALALDAALAAVCAAEQGYFESFHDLLFASLTESDSRRKRWRDYAAEAGVPNTNAFEDCLLSGRPGEV